MTWLDAIGGVVGAVAGGALGGHLTVRLHYWRQRRRFRSVGIVQRTGEPNALGDIITPGAFRRGLEKAWSHRPAPRAEDVHVSFSHHQDVIPPRKRRLR